MNEWTTPAHVLVVDDDAGLADFILEILADARHAARAVSNADDARALIEQDGWDVVITDLRMPGTSGMELIEWIKSYDPRVAVLAITAFGSIDTAVQAIRLGAADYITKPFAATALLLAVDKALRERRMQLELSRLKTEVDDRYGFESIVSRSLPMQEIIAVARRVADSPSTVLITGASGVGKEVLARAIHHASRRRARPFVAINCAAIPDNLLESELFGHKRGSFTGAVADKPGLFLEANGGTLFLDEIGDLPAALQVKLLRVLQDREIRPVGGTRPQPIDVRLLAATHRDLRKSIANGTFREDLYYRLCVIEIAIPRLMDRPDDVMPLAEHFLAQSNSRLQRTVKGFSGAAKRLLCGYAWPGNVRELQNAVERAVNLCAGDLIAPDDLPRAMLQVREEDYLDRAADQQISIPDLERAYALRVLARVGGNKTRAASILGIDRRTLHRWLDERDDSAGADPETDGSRSK